MEIAYGPRYRRIVPARTVCESGTTTMQVRMINQGNQGLQTLHFIVNDDC